MEYYLNQESLSYLHPRLPNSILLNQSLDKKNSLHNLKFKSYYGIYGIIPPAPGSSCLILLEEIGLFFSASSYG